MAATKRAKVSSLAARQVPWEVLQDHGVMETVDFMLFLIAFNHENRYIVVEALAGCGKTFMLTGLVKRINQKKAVLLLSFTKQAVTIARVRTDDGIHVQTFDSLFYQTVKHGISRDPSADRNTDAYTYETFRDVSETLSEEDLQDFVGQATSRYAMDEIEYIMVDEAQDTPPQAFRILETFRDMGKTVIITGDRNQAIFGFMRTESLFELIPSSQKVVHHLRTSRRCCPDVVDFLNGRFALGMKSAYTSALGPDVIECVCVQAQYNATLGRLYAKYLFTLDAVLKVSVSEGESTTKFWEAVHSETSRIYSTSLAKARDIVEHRQQALAQKHRLWAQTPRHWRLPMFVFSTVHHFKGGECDVTILADDVDICTRTDNLDTERMKYVAGSRARWGIVDTKSFTWAGHAGARQLFHTSFLKCREQASRATAPRISSVSDLPTCMVPLIASPLLDPWVAEYRRLFVSMESPPPPVLSPSAAMKVGSLAGILIGWMVERTARQHGVPHMDISCTEYRANAFRDRKYARLKRQGMVPPEMDAEITRLIARRKIQATLGRYLVVTHGWSPVRPLILRAAMAKAQLQSFVLCCSLLSLERTRLQLASTVRLVQIVEQIERNHFPGILGEPATWWSVSLQQPMPPNSIFFYRGSYDILIVDRQRVCHLVEVKTVRSVSPSHVLQALLYRTVMDVSLGSALKGGIYIYEANRNALCTMDPSAVVSLTREDDGVVAELDRVLYAKVVPKYYPTELTVDALGPLL